MGKTDAQEAVPGTIHGDFGNHLGHNLIYGSNHEDSGANEHEIDLFFDESELIGWKRDTASWVYEDTDGH
jgi:nucleoside-diphosphate kinase